MGGVDGLVDRLKTGDFIEWFNGDGWLYGNGWFDCGSFFGGVGGSVGKSNLGGLGVVVDKNLDGFIGSRGGVKMNLVAGKAALLKLPSQFFSKVVHAFHASLSGGLAAMVFENRKQDGKDTENEIWTSQVHWNFESSSRSGDML